MPALETVSHSLRHSLLALAYCSTNRASCSLRLQNCGLHKSFSTLRDSFSEVSFRTCAKPSSYAEVLILARTFVCRGYRRSSSMELEV